MTRDPAVPDRHLFEQLRLIREAQDAAGGLVDALARSRLEAMSALRDRGVTLEEIGRVAGVSKQQVARLLAGGD